MLLVFSSAGRVPKSAGTVGSATLDFVVALCMLPLSHLEHYRSLRPSALLSTYLFLTLLLNIAQARTYWLLSGGWTDYAACYSVSFSAKLAVLIFESWDKTHLLPQPYQQRSPEERAGVLSLRLFAWLNGLFVTGYRRLLDIDDLYPTDRALKSQYLGERLQKSWIKKRESRWAL